MVIGGESVDAADGHGGQDEQYGDDEHGRADDIDLNGRSALRRAPDEHGEGDGRTGVEIGDDEVVEGQREAQQRRGEDHVARQGPPHVGVLLAPGDEHVAQLALDGSTVEERRKTLGDFTCFCLGCGVVWRYFLEGEAALPAECPHCGSGMAPEHAHFRCGACGCLQIEAPPADLRSQPGLLDRHPPDPVVTGGRGDDGAVGVERRIDRLEREEQRELGVDAEARHRRAGAYRDRTRASLGGRGGRIEFHPRPDIDPQTIIELVQRCLLRADQCFIKSGVFVRGERAVQIVPLPVVGSARRARGIGSTGGGAG